MHSIYILDPKKHGFLKTKPKPPSVHVWYSQSGVHDGSFKPRTFMLNDCKALDVMMMIM